MKIMLKMPREKWILLLLSVCLYVIRGYSQNEIITATQGWDYKFEYQLTSNGDTLVVASYFVIKGDTVNEIDANGKKIGRWIEAVYQETTVSLDTIVKVNKLENLCSSELIAENENVLMMLSPELKVRLKLIETEGCLFVPEDSEKREGFYLEEYWFGFLKGSYKNGLRCGKWELIPHKQSGSIIVIQTFDDFSSIFPVFHQRKRIARFSKVVSFEEGCYINGKRHGVWLWSDEEYSLHKKFIYDNGNLQTTWIKVGAIDWRLAEQVSVKDSLSILTLFNQEGDVRGRFDISHLPKRIKCIGEQPYFYLYPLSR